MKVLKRAALAMVLVACGIGGTTNVSAFERWHRPFFGGPLLVPVPVPRPICGYGFVPVWKRDFYGHWVRVCAPAYR